MDNYPLSDLSPADLPAGAAEYGPAPRLMGRVNWIGFWTLLLKEVRRFIKVYMQTIAAPVVTTLLFYVVFSVAIGPGRAASAVPGQVSFLAFLAPGLIMMAMTQNA